MPEAMSSAKDTAADEAKKQVASSDGSGKETPATTDNKPSTRGYCWRLPVKATEATAAAAAAAAAAMKETRVPSSSVGDTSARRASSPPAAEARGDPSNGTTTTILKSRHVVHFAEPEPRAGDAKRQQQQQPALGEPMQDRGRRSSSPPPAAPATAPVPFASHHHHHPAAVPGGGISPASTAPTVCDVSPGDSSWSRIGKQKSPTDAACGHPSMPMFEPGKMMMYPPPPSRTPTTANEGVAAASRNSSKKDHEALRQQPLALPVVFSRDCRGRVGDVGGGGGGDATRARGAGTSSSSGSSRGSSKSKSSTIVSDPPASTIGTFANQSRLPKLEIPPLSETLQRYLVAVAPLLSPEALAVTKTVVNEFESSGEGEALQKALLEYSADKDSYVEEFWNDSYLTPKSSVVLNLNPFFVFETPILSTHADETGEGKGGFGGGGGGGGDAGLRSPRGHGAQREGGSTACDGSGSQPAYYQRERFPPQPPTPTPVDGAKGSPPSSRPRAATGAAAAATTVGEERQKQRQRQRQARRAASLLYSSLRFAAAVRSETLPPDLWRNTPLCMAQYRRLFGAHRKAVENDPDEMRVCEDSRHVVIICRNQFYCFSALHADGRVGVTEEELEEIVVAVQEDASASPLSETAAGAVGVLTTGTRDDWAVARRKLAAADEANRRYLQLVDTALFVLCLDHTSPRTATEIAASCLHGSYALEGDVQVGTCTNRWYDKLQLIVFENGAAGVNFEHTWVDGHTVLRFASDVFADIIYRFANHLTSTAGGARGRDGMGAVFPADRKAFSPCKGRTPMKMDWRLSKEMRRDVYFAETRISDLIRQHDVQALEYDTFGKRFITQNKMSPDAFLQMAIVYGYYGLYGDVVSAYEPVLTKAFLKGRTEALRTVTMEVKSFLEAFNNPDIPAKRKMLSLRTAMVSHGRLVRLAAKGKGVDRHLFALLCMAKRNVEAATAAAAAAAGGASKGGEEASAEGGDSGEARPFVSSPGPSPPRIPALFEDEAWRVLNHVILSTSNCGNPSLRLFGFGPVVRDGFGIGYIIKENQLKLVVTSKNRQTDRFIGKIRQFFDKVFEGCRPLQIQRRVKVVSSEEQAPDDSGGYSMWGSFSSRGEKEKPVA